MTTTYLQEEMSKLAALALAHDHTTIASGLYLLLEAMDFSQEKSVVEMMYLYNSDILKPLREDAPECEREGWRVAA